MSNQNVTQPAESVVYLETELPEFSDEIQCLIAVAESERALKALRAPAATWIESLWECGYDTAPLANALRKKYVAALASGDESTARATWLLLRSADSVLAHLENVATVWAKEASR